MNSEDISLHTISPPFQFQSLNECLQLADLACNEKDFEKAIKLCSRYLELDCDEIEKASVYSYRSRFYIELGDFESALEDANVSLQNSNKCVLAYICKAECLIALERMADAMVVYTAGLFHATQNAGGEETTNEESVIISKDIQILMVRFVSCCQDDLSPIKESFSDVYTSARQLRLSSSPVVLLTTVGHGLLSIGYNSAAMSILEYALKCNSKSLKIRSLILSALANAKWNAKCFDEAIQLMEDDFKVSSEMNDYSQQARCLANLGAAYFTMRNYAQALVKENDLCIISCEWYKSTSFEEARECTALALSRKGRAYQAMNNLTGALEAFKSSVSMYKEIGNTLAQAEQFGNTGIVYALLEELDKAIECHEKQLEMVQSEASQNESHDADVSRVYSLEISRACYFLGFDYCQVKKYTQALKNFNSVLEIGKNLKDARIQIKAYHGIGATYLQLKNAEKSLEAHKEQLKLAQSEGCDITLQIQALTNLSMSHCEKTDFNTSIKLLKQALALASQYELRSLLGKLCSHIANCFAAICNYEEAINHFVKAIEYCRNVGDQVFQCKAVGFLGLAYQCNKELANAETSLLQQESIASSIPEMPDLWMDAYFNLGSFYTSTEQFGKALKYFEGIAAVVKKQESSIIVARVLSFLGYIYFRLQDFKTSIQKYREAMKQSKIVDDQVTLAAVCYHLGLVHQVLGKFEVAKMCYETYYHTSVHNGDHVAVFRSLGALGNANVFNNDLKAARGCYEQQLQLALDHRDRELEIEAHSFLGLLNLKVLNSDIALQNFTKMRDLSENQGNITAKCHATLYLGRVYMKLGNFHTASKCFEDTLNLAHRFGYKSFIPDVYNSIADCQQADKQYQAAVETYNRVLLFLEENAESGEKQIDNYSNLNIQVMSDASLRISVLQNIARCYSFLLESRQELEIYKMLYTFCVEKQRWPSAASAFRDLVNLLVKSEQTSNADYLLQLLEFCPHNVASVLSNSPCRNFSNFLSDDSPQFSDESPFHAPLYDYASLLMDVGKYEEAIPLLKRSLDFVCGKHAKASSSNLAIAICYDRGGLDNQKAFAAYDVALQTAMLVEGDEAKLAMAQLCSGSFLIERNRLDDGLQMLKQCADLSCRIDDGEIQQKASAKIASAYFVQKNYDEASKFYGKALACASEMTRDEQEEDAANTEQVTLLWDWTLKCCKCHFEKGDYSKCVSELDQLQQNITSQNLTGDVDFLQEKTSAYLQCLQLRISLSLAQGDVKKSIFYCNLHKSIKMQTLNLQSATSLEELSSSDAMTSVQNECLDALNKCLEEENCFFLCYHCDDNVFHSWMFNLNILLTHSISLSDLRSVYGIENAQTTADFIGFLSRRLVELINNADPANSNLYGSRLKSLNECMQNFAELFLPEKFVCALKESNVQRLRFILDDTTMLVPVNMFKLENFGYLGDLFEIGVMLKLSRRSVPERVATNKLISIFGSLDRSIKPSLDAISDLCGGQSDVSFCDVANSMSLQPLMEDLHTRNSSQVCYANFKFDWSNSSRKFEGISFADSNSVDHRNCKISFEEIMSIKIDKKLIILCLSLSPGMSFDFFDISEGLYLTMCAFMGAGAHCIIVSQLPIEEEFFLSKFTQPFLSDILEGSTVESAFQSTAQRMRVRSCKYSENSFNWFSFLNVCSGSFPVSLSFNHYSTLAHLGRVLQVCDEEKGNQNEHHINLNFICEKLSEAIERLRNANRHPLVTRIEQMKNVIVGANSVLKFLSSLKFRVETLSDDVMIHYPIVDYGLQLQFFLDLTSKLMKFTKCSWHVEVAKLFEDGDQSLLVAISSYLETLLDSLSGVKLDRDTYSLKIDNLLLLSSPVFFSLMKCAKIKVNVQCEATHDNSSLYMAEMNSSTRLADLKLLFEVINHVLQGPGAGQMDEISQRNAKGRSSADPRSESTNDHAVPRRNERNKISPRGVFNSFQNTPGSDVETVSQQSGRSLNNTVKRAPKIKHPGNRRQNHSLSEKSFRLQKVPILAENQVDADPAFGEARVIFEHGNNSFLEGESLSRFKNSATRSFTELVTGPDSSSKSDSRNGSDTLIDFVGLQDTHLGNNTSKPVCSKTTNSALGLSSLSNETPSNNNMKNTTFLTNPIGIWNQRADPFHSPAVGRGTNERLPPRAMTASTTLSSERSAFTPVIPKSQFEAAKKVPKLSTSSSKVANSNIEAQITSSSESVSQKMARNKYKLPYQLESKPNNSSAAKTSILF